MLTPDASGSQHEKMIRRWIKAELERYYTKAASTQLSTMSKHTPESKGGAPRKVSCDWKVHPSMCI